MRQGPFLRQVETMSEAELYVTVLAAKTPLEYLRVQVVHLRAIDSGSGNAEMMEKAADEIEGLHSALDKIKTITCRAPQLPPDQEAAEPHGTTVDALGPLQRTEKDDGRL